MPLEELLCQATKRPNGGFVNARYLWVEGLTTFEKSLYQTAKMPMIGSVNSIGGGNHAPSGILQSTEKINMLKKIHVPLGKGFFRRAINRVFRPQKLQLFAHS
jgi:hypothetical protein